MPLHMPKIVSIGMRASTSAYGLCSTTSALALLAVPAALAVVVLLCCGNNNEAATEERVDAATPEDEEAFTAGSNAALNWWRRPLLIQVGLALGGGAGHGLLPSKTGERGALLLLLPRAAIMQIRTHSRHKVQSVPSAVCGEATAGGMCHGE